MCAPQKKGKYLCWAIAVHGSYELLKTRDGRGDRAAEERGKMRSAENVKVYYAGQKTWLQLVCCALAAGTGCLLFQRAGTWESGEAEVCRGAGKAEVQGKVDKQKCGDDIYYKVI